MNQYLITDIHEYIDIYLHGYHYGKVCDYINEMMFIYFENPWDNNYTPRFIMEDEFDYDKYSLSYDDFYVYFMFIFLKRGDTCRDGINFRKLDFSYKYSQDENMAKISNFKNRCMTDAHVPQNYGYTHFSRKSLMRAMGELNNTF